jgi:hypothetical protein
MARRIDTQAVISAIRLFIGGKPAAPAAGYDLLYAKNNGLYLENEGGTETGPFMANPMTAAGDVIIGGTSGAATRLAKGNDGEVLKLASGAPTWAADAGMTNPMTTAGDLILGGASGAAGRLAIGANATVLTSNGTTASWAATAATVINDYICIQDVKTTGTNGGSFNSGDWRIRDLNTEQSDTAGHATLSSNQITLAAGTYIVKITAPAVRVNGHQAALYNITGTAFLLFGDSCFAPSDHDICTVSTIAGKIVLAAPTVLEVWHKCFTTCANYGFGADPGLNSTNVYTIAEFWKVA